MTECDPRQHFVIDDEDAVAVRQRTDQVAGARQKAGPDEDIIAARAQFDPRTRFSLTLMHIPALRGWR